MIVDVPLDPSAEENLLQRARAAGKPVGELIREAVVATRLDTKLEPYDPSTDQRPAAELTPEERVARFRWWTSRIPRTEGLNVDVSRDSIYEGRGE